ncbi:GNAT family N-acetyltransferase [Sphingorhabdus sp. EL138]|uniref:GNAT family N-acetyltransferase n=1 Tax=Sphingorhabdus sp. EL138 TaxID=2073156 RepID=UPI000D68E1E4|nr:GNAT family N-acetyltransferase [Sphingorhabdus sp. EL138]
MTIAMNSEYHDNFQSAQAEAGEKLDRSVQKSLFDRMEWLKQLHEQCLPDTQPLIVHSAENDAQAWMFLTKKRFGNYTALANWYNFTYRPIFTGKFDEVTKLALLAGVAKKLKSLSHHIEIAPVPEEDYAASLTERAFEQAGWVVFKSKADDNHILSVNGRTFDQYWAERPGQLRNTVRRKAKKNIVSIRIETEFSAEHWADYCDVYAKSWKPEEGSPDFLKNIAQQEAAAGCLRLGLAYIDGKPVAAQFWTVENGEALIHKLAHIADATKSSPGTLLSVAMFQHAIDVDRVKLIDFGTGNDPYKREWMEDVRTRYRLEMFWPNNPLSWLPILRHRMSALVGKR